MKVYKITRFAKSNNLADQLCLVASKSNGNALKISIDEMIGYISCEMILWTAGNKFLTITKVNNQHLILEQDSERLLEIIEVDDLEFPN